MHLTAAEYTPHTQHVNKMLLGNIVFLVHVPLQRGEDILFIHEVIARSPFNVRQWLVRQPILVSRSVCFFGWDGKVLELLSKYNNGLLREKRVLRSCRPEII